MAYKREYWVDADGNPFPALVWHEPKNDFSWKAAGHFTIVLICCILIFVAFLGGLTFANFYDQDGYASFYLYDYDFKTVTTPSGIRNYMQDLYFDFVTGTEFSDRKIWFHLTSYDPDGLTFNDRVGDLELQIWNGSDIVTVVPDVFAVVRDLEFSVDGYSIDDSNSQFLNVVKFTNLDGSNKVLRVKCTSGLQQLLNLYINYSKYAADITPDFSKFFLNTGFTRYVIRQVDIMMFYGGRDDAGVSAESYEPDPWGLFPNLFPDRDLDADPERA